MSNSILSELKQLIRWGVIVSVNKNNTARVQFSDIDNIVSYDLHILVSNSNKNRYQAPPDVGCNALCIMMPTGNSAGFIVGTFYNEKNPAPIDSLDNAVNWTFQDGTVLNYNTATSTLTADVSGPVEIKTTSTAIVDAATSATVVCPDIQLAGNVTITGNLTVVAGGEVVAQISSKNMTITGQITSTNDILITDGNLSVRGNVSATGKISGSNI
ncbi:phage baseplate assembly protein V [Gilliamella sp. CG16]|uniref:phage baseplate assembly protein V n=1 Tax=Gilliamella sp. CG16 TaxID=3351503 RepID=UPI0039859B3F